MLDLTSREGDAAEAQGPAMVPPCPAPLPRPQLQPQDVVNAVWPNWFAGVAAHQPIVAALLAEHSSDFLAEQLCSCLKWMLVQWRDVAWYLRV